jgi:hypothetical protein
VLKSDGERKRAARVSDDPGRYRFGVPPRPALEPASPSEPADARTTRELAEALFTDGEWRLVRIRARWRDGDREVVQAEYHAGGDTRSGAFVVDEAKMRKVG